MLHERNEDKKNFFELVQLMSLFMSVFFLLGWRLVIKKRIPPRDSGKRMMHTSNENAIRPHTSVLTFNCCLTLLAPNLLSIVVRAVDTQTFLH